MADILKIFLLIVGILCIYVSYWLLSQALFPSLVERASNCYGRPVKITLIGLGTAVVPVVLGLIFANLPNPLIKFVGISMVVVPVMLGLAGSAGLTLRIGAGLPSPVDAQQPWKRVLRGGIVLALSFLLPIVGWFVLPIWALVSGLGAFVLCIREKTPAPRIASPADLVPAGA
jgi:hypothetical protein